MPKKPEAHINQQLPLLDRVKPAETEVEAYEFIRRQLRELGWNVKDPSRGTGGQV